MYILIPKIALSSLSKTFYLCDIYINTPKCTINPPKIFFKSLIKSSNTFTSICHNFLSSTYHTWVHCLPLTILFETYLSYGSRPETFYINVSEYILYHCRAEYMHPYMEHNTNIYRTFCPFWHLTLFLCSRFI